MAVTLANSNAHGSHLTTVVRGGCDTAMCSLWRKGWQQNFSKHLIYINIYELIAR